MAQMKFENCKFIIDTNSLTAAVMILQFSDGSGLDDFLLLSLLQTMTNKALCVKTFFFSI